MQTAPKGGSVCEAIVANKMYELQEHFQHKLQQQYNIVKHDKWSLNYSKKLGLSILFLFINSWYIRLYTRGKKALFAEIGTLLLRSCVKNGVFSSFNFVQLCPLKTPFDLYLKTSQRHIKIDLMQWGFIIIIILHS